MKKTCVICTGVVWLGSPATIALSVLCAMLCARNEATCKLTAWDILIPVRVLLVIWCELIDSKVNNSTYEFWVLSLGLKGV